MMYLIIKILHLKESIGSEIIGCNSDESELERIAVSENPYIDNHVLSTFAGYLKYIEWVSILNHCPVIMSPTDARWSIHRGLFDFDGIKETDVRQRCKDMAITGHLYKTGHGIHLYADQYYKQHQYNHIAYMLNTCLMHNELGRLRGLWGLRCGMKLNRPPDMYYIGHTSNLVIKKDRFLIIRDWIYKVSVRQYKLNLTKPGPFGLRLKPEVNNCESPFDD